MIYSIPLRLRPQLKEGVDKIHNAAYTGVMVVMLAVMTATIMIIITSQYLFSALFSSQMHFNCVCKVS